MKEHSYIFQKIGILTGIEIISCYQEKLQSFGKVMDYNPLKEWPELRGHLMKMADQQNIPAVYQDAHQVLFACIKKQEIYYLLGPMCLNHMNHLEQHLYYRAYGMSRGEEKKLPVFLLSKALALIELFAGVLLDEEYSDEDIIKGNNMTNQLEENFLEQDQILFHLEEEKNEFYHHTYKEERDLLECVREGMVEEALQCNMHIDIGTGRMSDHELTHWKNVVVVAVALCTRAAIEGGLSPKEAYQLSDYYLKKSDGCKNISSLIACRNQAVRDLTERVQKKKNGMKCSSYVERCKDYIYKHYREKIYLDEVASSLGVSGTYLSRLFSKETGIRLQDYITMYRVDKAANLLVYSEESLAYIAEYVNFPSQSYFANAFKKYKKLTPKKYREQYKPTEFRSQK